MMQRSFSNLEYAAKPKVTRLDTGRRSVVGPTAAMADFETVGLALLDVRNEAGALIPRL